MNMLKLGPVRLLIAGVSLAGSGCALSHPNSGQAATPSAACTASVGTPGQDPPLAPTVLPSAPQHALRIDRFYTLSGDCADEAQSFEMRHILFADGRVMAIGDHGSLSLVMRRPTPVEPSALLPQEAPRLRGAPLAYAARVGGTNVRPLIPSAYIGVWSAGGKSIVAGFRIGADGRASTPRPVLESHLPITGVGYFPSPDSPGGQVGIVQRVSAGTVRLLNYHWYHPGL